MSSMRLCLSSAIERCICSIPFCSAADPEPGVHTLVAMNALGMLLGCEQAAEHAFRVGIHGRGIDERRPGTKERVQHLAQGFALGL
jgi:hypothetical protein